jgi:hypothetical protein
MKITDTIISIPPYLSTSWDAVQSLHMENGNLIFSLKNDGTVSVPNLPREVIEQIFTAHASFLETHIPHHSKKSDSEIILQKLQFPFQFHLGTIEGIGTALQHNPAYSGLPPIPEEIAAKIASLAKIISEEDLNNMPPPEHNCNCMYCQIIRILNNSADDSIKENVPDHPSLSVDDEKIADEDLKFSEWDVTPIGENMYKVTNKLHKEEYTVFLGEPVGCTCGKSNCEHIVAVLRS